MDSSVGLEGQCLTLLYRLQQRRLNVRPSRVTVNDTDVVARGRFAIVVVLLAVGIVINVADTLEIERHQRWSYALGTYDHAPNLQRIALEAKDSVIGSAFHLPATLGEHTSDDACIYIYADSPTRVDILRGFSQLDCVVKSDYEAKLTVLETIPLQDQVIFEGTDRFIGDFSVAAVDRNARGMSYWIGPSRTWIVDHRLRPREGLQR